MISVTIFAITRNGASLAEKISSSLPHCHCFVSERYASACKNSVTPFPPKKLASLISDMWKKHDGFIFIMATGIVVRMIAPLITSKQTDPAVVVMDETGKFAISLLSGHMGGANDLAERCAFITGARAVITTATDANSLPSFDILAKDLSWGIDDVSKVKNLNRMLLDNEKIAVVDSSAKTRCWFAGKGHLSFYDTFAEALKSDASGYMFVTNRHIPLHKQPENLLILRPQNLVLGIGCNRGTSFEEIDQFVQPHLKRLFLSIKSVAIMASAKAKEDEPGLCQFAQRYGLKMIFYSSSELNQVFCPTAPSVYVQDAIGANGVAEPAAILASGGGRLILQKIKSTSVTLAVAEIENEKGTVNDN